MNGEAIGNDDSSSANVIIEKEEVKSILPSANRSKSKDAKPGKSNPSAILLERITRWLRVPKNETMVPPPQKGKHYRLVFAVTADVSDSCV